MIEKHLYTSDEKLQRFGYGEWIEEPDYIEFEHKGFVCKIIRVVEKEPYYKELRMFGGYLCGYIKIPSNHPCYRKKYEDIDLDVHGGLTFDGLSGIDYWIGFDCAHSGDYNPSLEKSKSTDERMIEFKKTLTIPDHLKNHSLFNPIYKNVEFCINECKSMAEQLLKLQLDISNNL